MMRVALPFGMGSFLDWKEEDRLLGLRFSSTLLINHYIPERAFPITLKWTSDTHPAQAAGHGASYRSLRVLIGGLTIAITKSSASYIHSVDKIRGSSRWPLEMKELINGAPVWNIRDMLEVPLYSYHRKFLFWSFTLGFLQLYPSLQTVVLCIASWSEITFPRCK